MGHLSIALPLTITAGRTPACCQHPCPGRVAPHRLRRAEPWAGAVRTGGRSLVRLSPTEGLPLLAAEALGQREGFGLVLLVVGHAGKVGVDRGRFQGGEFAAECPG